jgi:hypothetical protein
MMTDNPINIDPSADASLVDRALRELVVAEAPAPMELDFKLIWRKGMLLRHAEVERRATAPLEAGVAATVTLAALVAILLLRGAMASSPQLLASEAGEVAVYSGIAMLMTVTIAGFAALLASVRHEAGARGLVLVGPAVLS